MSFNQDQIKTVKDALELAGTSRAQKEALEKLPQSILENQEVKNEIAEYEKIIDKCTKLVMSGTLPLGAPVVQSSAGSSVISASVINTAFTRHFGHSKFQGTSPKETDHFLGLADSFQKSYIINRATGEPAKDKEQFFLSCLRAHLDVAPSRAIGDALDKVADYAAARKLINKHFGGKLNHLLVISEAAAIECDADLPLHDYAGKVQQKLNEAYEACIREFKRVNADKNMTVQDCFYLFGTHLLSEKLRLQMPDLYNKLIDKMSDSFRPDDLAAAAETLRRNMTPTDANCHYLGKRRDANAKHDNKNKNNRRSGRGQANRGHSGGYHKNKDSGSGDQQVKQTTAHAADEEEATEDISAISLACFRAAPVYQSLPTLVPDPYVTSIKFSHDTCSFATDVEIDSGSFATILPKKVIPQKILSQLKKAPLTISGLNGAAQSPLGYLEMKIVFDTGPELEAKVYVLEDAPCLLGRDVLRCRDVRSVELGKTYLRLNFENRYKSVPPQKVQLRKNYRVGVAKPNDGNEVQQVHNGSPILWVKQNLGIDLPTHAPLEHREKIAEDLKELKAAFATSSQSLGEFPEEAELPTVPGEVRNRKQIPIPQAQHSLVDEHIRNMLEDKVIAPCDDPKGWNSPIILVPKKDKTTRFCVNFAPTINKVASDKSDPFIVARMDETISSLGEGQLYFTVADLKNGYWQVKLKEEDQVKTAFQWRSKTYKFIRVPFGYTFSGSIFSRCVAKMLDHVKMRRNVQSYVDDLIQFGSSFTEYRESLRQLLKAVIKFGVKLKASKCQFLQREAHFLGRVITKAGVQTDPAYTRSLLSMPPPTNHRELRSLVGSLTWLKEFAEARMGEEISSHLFAHVMRPITALLVTCKRGAIPPPFEWTPEANGAFTQLKTRLANPPVISFPDFRHTFILHTDASDLACGGILTQIINGKTKLVAAVSHTFTRAEANWSVSEKECFGILWSVEKLSRLLKGTKFIIHTDHYSLMMRVGNAGRMLLTKKRFEKVEIWFISNVSEGEGQERGYIGVEQ